MVTNLILVYVVVAVILVAFRVLLVFGVNNECNNRDTEFKTAWTIITAVMGLIPAVVFAIFVPKTDKSNKKGKTILGIYLALFVSLILFITFVAVPSFQYEEENPTPGFDYDDLTFKNENGVEVICDKMGNEYTAEQYHDFKYYSEDGSAWMFVVDHDDDGYELYYMQNVETGEKISTGSIAVEGNKECFVRDDGYIVFYDPDDFLTKYGIYNLNEDEDSVGEYVHFDLEGHLLYSLDDVNFDKNGNVAFSNSHSNLNDFKYSQIPKEAFNSFD